MAFIRLTAAEPVDLGPIGISTLPGLTVGQKITLNCNEVKLVTTVTQQSCNLPDSRDLTLVILDYGRSASTAWLAVEEPYESVTRQLQGIDEPPDRSDKTPV